ncbi:MAG: hypothetical protein JWO67_4437 [Streptosporangiaceae bacterium]|jgi:hypothetical protein|nr:hypothetical protein [Streptosporangiaceae bacterium]
MPCALCGDILATQVGRCPACGAWARRRDLRALGLAVIMLLGFNAFVALGSGISLSRMMPALDSATTESYDAAALGRAVSPYSDVLTTSVMMTVLTGLLYLPWLWLAYRQVPLRRYRRGWVIAAWLCPVVNLWMPPRLVYDAWANSGRCRPAERHGISVVITAWWVSVLSAACLMWIFPGTGTGTLAQGRFAVRLTIAATATEALAAVLCMMTVFRISRLQAGRSG